MGGSLFDSYCVEIDAALAADDPIAVLDTLYRSSLHRVRDRDALFAAMSATLAARDGRPRVPGPAVEATLIPHLGTVG